MCLVGLICECWLIAWAKEAKEKKEEEGEKEKK